MAEAGVFVEADEASPPIHQLLVDLPFTLDASIADRLAIGVIVLASDQTLEHEWRAMLHGLSGVAFYESRLWNDTTVNAETLSAMERDIAEATRLILPGEDLGVVCFGCASGTIVIGEDKVFERIRSVRPDAECTSPPTAAVAALGELGARKVGLLTPYVGGINDTIRDYLLAKGFEVPIVGTFSNDNDNQVARISVSSMKDAIARLAAAANIDAVYVSCTSLKLAEAIEKIEEEVGLPVLSSNHVMAWHALRLGNVQQPIEGFGRIFRHSLSARPHAA
mgnify:CR=1 FL=1